MASGGKSILGRGNSQCKGPEAGCYQEKVTGCLSLPGCQHVGTSHLHTPSWVERRIELGEKISSYNQCEMA